MTPEDVRWEAEAFLREIFDGVPAGNPPLENEIESATERLRSMLARDRREMALAMLFTLEDSTTEQMSLGITTARAWLLSKAEELETK